MDISGVIGWTCGNKAISWLSLSMSIFLCSSTTADINMHSYTHTIMYNKTPYHLTIPYKHIIIHSITLTIIYTQMPSNITIPYKHILKQYIVLKIKMNTIYCDLEQKVSLLSIVHNA